MIPDRGVTVKDIDTVDDLFITSWDYTHRTPRFYSKVNYDKYGPNDPVFNDTFDHQVDLVDMTLASASTPLYYQPYQMADGTVYISGDNLALSPAMFAYYYANEKLDKSESSIRIVSIGSINELSEKIDTQASLLQWLLRLTSLGSSVKKHTMDYMTQHLLEKNGHELHKFEINKPRQWFIDFYIMKNRASEVSDAAQDMVFRNKAEIDRLIDKLVDERL